MQRDSQGEKNKRKRNTNEAKMEVKVAQSVEAPVAKLDDMGSILKSFLVELETLLSELSSDLHTRMCTHWAVVLQSEIKNEITSADHSALITLGNTKQKDFCFSWLLLIDSW